MNSSNKFDAVLLRLLFSTCNVSCVIDPSSTKYLITLKLIVLVWVLIMISKVLWDEFESVTVQVLKPAVFRSSYQIFVTSSQRQEELLETDWYLSTYSNLNWELTSRASYLELTSRASYLELLSHLLKTGDTDNLNTWDTWKQLHTFESIPEHAQNPLSSSYIHH